MPSRLLLFIASFLISACASLDLPEATRPPVPVYSEKYLVPGDYAETVTVNGIERQFLVHMPPGYRLDTPMPLVINLHGRGATARQQESVSRFHAKADRERFVVVSPQALGLPTTWWPAAGPNGQADLDFFREMLAYLEGQIHVDPARIYVTGFSNGGAMANRLACTMSDKIAAIAPVAGAHPQMESCTPLQPIAVMAWHGQQDAIIPYLGDGDYLPPVLSWTAAWARRNVCDPTPVLEFPRQGVTRQTWLNCAGHGDVVLYTIQEGSHTWPGSRSTLDPSADVYATDQIWAFFATHSKDARQSKEPAPEVVTGPEASAPPTPITEPLLAPTATEKARYPGPGDYQDRVYSRAEPRLFDLHIPPSYRPDKPIPLLLVLHGGGQEVSDMVALTGLSIKADEVGFVVAYPQASLLRWDPRPEKDGGSDVIFIRILLVFLRRHLNIDPARIYATGFSSGGSMVHRLGCDLSDQIAAIAPVSGAYWPDAACEPSRPVSMVAFHGTADTYIGYQDEAQDVPRWAADWAARNNCDPVSTQDFQQGDVRGETWGHCESGAKVTLYTIEGGRHIWPGSDRAHQFFPEVKDVSANDLIWAFFAAHPKTALGSDGQSW
jgi:polyhydroxybutyrate depolymerase